MENKITPIGTRVLVEPIESSMETESGIILTDNSADTTKRGTVLDTGVGCKLGLKEGDEILYPKNHRGTEVYGVELIDENQILAKL